MCDIYGVSWSACVEPHIDYKKTGGMSNIQHDMLCYCISP